MEVRLQKIISAAGIASRRAAEKLIEEGRVQVNGATVTELGTKADPEVDDIRVDERRVKQAQRHRYFLLNKPRGYVTTRSDPEHRPTVLDLLKGVREYVYPVGRLDFDSEGLLILTNDGELAAMITHPKSSVCTKPWSSAFPIPTTSIASLVASSSTGDARARRRSSSYASGVPRGTHRSCG
jgi:23S rRNA pseudouridine2605 synthase